MFVSDCSLAVGWPTSRAGDGAKNARTIEGSHREVERKGAPEDLSQAAALTVATGWPTPCANDAGSHRNATARRLPGSKVGKYGVTLTDAATMAVAGWATPAARDHKDTPGMATVAINKDGSVRSRTDQLPRQAATVANGKKLGVILTSLSLQATTATGPTATGSSVTTLEVPDGVQLNQDHSRWLQGYPATWGG